MSQALFTASKLRVFDVLEARPGQGAVEVAQEIQASVKGTERLLEACVSLGLLDSHERCKSGTHTNQPTCIYRKWNLWMSPLLYVCYAVCWFETIKVLLIWGFQKS